MQNRIVASVICFCLALTAAQSGYARYSRSEIKTLQFIATSDLKAIKRDDPCRSSDKYVVYLIDNFTQTVKLIPEVKTSHGEMLMKMLLSGRANIEVKKFNTPLSIGLAKTIKDLVEGKCIDAVVSSTPGSNYTYNQISSLFQYKVKIDADNILSYRNSLRQLLNRIAFHGFPSVDWLKQIDVNSVKLKSDARVIAFIGALDAFDVPIFLPYGNSDSNHKGQSRSINILSLSPNAKVYSALDQYGNRVPDFPYSPLSSGDERAVFELRECPDPENPLWARLDINDDGFYDYAYPKTGDIAYMDEGGQTLFAPHLISSEDFNKLKEQIKADDSCSIKREMVLTVKQYNELRQICQQLHQRQTSYRYVWLNSAKYKNPYYFDARCFTRGRIAGTSFIPPNKVKEYLP